MNPTISALHPYLNSHGHANPEAVLDAIGPVAKLPDFAPLMAVLQAKNDELGHLLTMDALAFQLILEFPEQAARVAGEALARIQRSAA